MNVARFLVSLMGLAFAVLMAAPMPAADAFNSVYLSEFLADNQHGLKDDDGDYVLFGDLTVNNVTRQVEFDLEFDGVSPDPWGGTRAGFEGTTTISRKEWGVDFNIPLEGDKLMIGDKVNVVIAVEAVHQAAEVSSAA